MSGATATCLAASAGTACSAVKSARQSHQRPSQSRGRLLARAVSQSDGERCSRSLAAGLAAVASIPLLFNGPALAFVGNTAKDFSEKVDRYTPSISDIQDVTSTKVEQATPDVPLPGLKQKGKEAAAIGKAPAQSGPGAADQLPVPEAVPSNDSIAQAKNTVQEGGGVSGGDFSISDSADKVKGVADDAKGALKDVAPKKGLFGRIKEEALTSNSPSVQMNK